MDVHISCPYCSFSKDVPLKGIPPHAKRVRCPKCGQSFEIDLDDLTEGRCSDERNAQQGLDRDKPGRCGQTEGIDDSVCKDSIEGGFFQEVFFKIKAILFEPASFFRNLPCDEELRESLSFGLLLGSFGSMLGVFWQVIMAVSGMFFPAIPFLRHFAIWTVFLVVIVTIPVMVVIGLFVRTCIIHFGLFVVNAGKNGYKTTFRVVAYTQAPEVFSIIPFVGSLISGFWGIIILIIGLREAHRTSALRVIMALLVPAVLVLIVSVICFYLIFVCFRQNFPINQYGWI